MRISPHVLMVFLVASSPACLWAQSQKPAPSFSRILAAKSVYFDNRTGVDAVGEKALLELKKWGQFKIVQDGKQADLVFLLTCDPYKGGYVIVSGGQTGTVGENGQIHKDWLPNFGREAPVRDAYLTVIDPKTGESLWSDSHVWGGLLTGFNSAGERLVRKLEKQAKK